MANETCKWPVTEVDLKPKNSIYGNNNNFIMFNETYLAFMQIQTIPSGLLTNHYIVLLTTPVKNTSLNVYT